MTPSEIERKAEEDGFLRGYHGIPDDVKLHKMSFVELAALLASCESGSAKFNVIERELKKHLAKDQAEINRKNVLLGACLGGIFGLVGVFLGANLKNSPSSAQIAPVATAQQPSSGGHTVTPPASNQAAQGNSPNTTLQGTLRDKAAPRP